LALKHFHWAYGGEHADGTFAVRLWQRHDCGDTPTMFGEDYFFGGMDYRAEDAAGFTAKFGKGGFHLCEKYTHFSKLATSVNSAFEIPHGTMGFLTRRIRRVPPRIP